MQGKRTDKPTQLYHQHLVSVEMGGHSNYEVRCSCGYTGYVASLSDVFAAEAALAHVREMQELADEVEQDERLTTAGVQYIGKHERKGE